MEELKTYLKCGVCLGEGVFKTTSDFQPQVIDPCPSCSGTGYQEVGKTDGATELADIQDRLNDIMDKLNDIFELVQQ